MSDALKPGRVVSDDALDSLLLEGLRWQHQGDGARAAACYRRVLELRAHHPDALHLLGVLALDAGRPADAVALIARALTREKRDPVMFNNHGLALQRHGERARARSSFRRALALKPDYAAAHRNLGILCQEAGDSAGAVECLRRAVALEPDAGGCYNLALALDDSGLCAEAIDAYREAIRLHPDFIEAHLNLANVLRELERLDEAAQYLECALRIRPDMAETRVVLGNVRMAQQRLHEARGHYLRALELRPDYSEVHGNLCNVLRGLGDFDGARAMVERALELAPFNADAHVTRALLLLARGEYALAWRDYEWRFKARSGKWYIEDPLRPGRLAPRPSRALPLDLSGKRVLLVREQGYGDELFFLRFAAVARARGAWLAYLASPPIAPLLRGCADLDAVVDEHTLPSDIDHVFSLPDLPLVLGMEGAGEIPPPLALRAHADARARALALLAAGGDGPYIGVTWRAGPKARLGESALRKSIAPAQLGHALRGWPGTAVIIQREPQAGDIAAFSEAYAGAVIDCSGLNTDLDNMLGLLSLLDEYVGVSNTNMHLAAGIGLAARVLVSQPAEWRWQLAGASSPWFPGFRLYREAADAGWDAALVLLTRDLSGVRNG